MIDIFTANPWQMTLGERSALEGVLAALKPGLAVEIGTAEGGSLRRIAAHSREVHSFDLVEPSLPVHEWGDVTLHTGDSHALLPAFLAERAERGDNIDFVLVDGDHSADGVRRDVDDLLASPAIRRTVILVHDTLNEEVRRGIDAVDFAGTGKVARLDLDFVPGHLSHGGAYHMALWGGLGIVLVDADAALTTDRGTPVFYGMAELLVPLRDALVRAEARGHEVLPGALPPINAGDGTPAAAPTTAAGPDVAELQEQLAATRAGLAAIEGSLSWKLTAPLRAGKQRALEWKRSRDAVRRG